MGTRADFYIGRGETAEWLGSIAWDGYEIPPKLWEAKTADKFRKRVKAMMEKRDDATFPADGWPWPWEDSNTTDYAYAFDETDGQGEVPEPDDLWNDDKSCVFPNMKAMQKVTLGRRSGLVIL